MGHDFTDRLKPAEPSGPDTLRQERAGSKIDVKPLSTFLLGPDFLQAQEQALSILTDDKLFSKAAQANLSRPERYMLGLARAKKLRRLADQHKWTDDTYEIVKYLVDDVSPYTLHTTMFRQTLREQASDAQQAYWLPRHGRWEIIGAYAQTEMGHGSNVRGIETEARWDPRTKEFILHSPTLTASKWWNGSLGRTANHAIVVAQLMLPTGRTTSGSPEYRKVGVQPFIVQVRDMKTHQPFEGIVIGDIGPKYGYAPMDNAYMLFDHFRIPHSAMLCRYATLDPETGVYSKPKNPGVVYGSLTEARSRIVMHARLVLARAVTVAVRYTCVRRQFKGDDDLPSTRGCETSVLDYSTVQIRILPLLATTFAFHFSGKKMKEVFTSTRQEVAEGNFARLADLHSMSSGLKSLCTDLAANGIETCRRALGGHGYGGYSGLKQLNDDYLSKPTVEGDNWMITQQVAKYLLKAAKSAVAAGPNQQASSTGIEATLRRHFRDTKDRAAPEFFDILGDDEAIVRAFDRRTAFLTFELYHAREEMKKPWNDLLIQMHRLSQAQSYASLVSNFYDGLGSLDLDPNLDPETTSVMRLLYRLFALFSVQQDGLEFLRSGAVSADVLAVLPTRILELMRQVRPHAVRLADAWAIPDYLLDSSLGRYDGKVYEDMFNRAHRLNPLNRLTFNPDYRTDEIVLGSGDGGAILAKL
ncbi:Peroxisomal acyl-coenzyme A oxidase 1 [Cladophialophora carrionii]|uniref:Acyl-coenzyme A oxidase n=1 Tax=Cladophialophora carrionii TaxID=86049 RepID=A0A1C1C7I4_9EURO|nr:Peroxisomal acyl-coenzyme A oxidase 1 [Cladophialophora carrionii]